MKAKKVWVILTENSSCLVNAVYLDREEAEKWVKTENRKLGYIYYYTEQSQLIG